MKGKLIIFGIMGVLILLIVLLATSLKRLGTKESKNIWNFYNLKLVFAIIKFNLLLIAIRYDNLAKVLGKVTEFEGLHFGPPGFYFIIFPSIYETMELDNITVIYLDFELNSVFFWYLILNLIVFD